MVPLILLPAALVQTPKPQEKAPQIEFRISAEFDTAASNPTIIRKYLQPKRDSILGAQIARELLSSLQAQVARAALHGVTVRLARDSAKDSTAEQWYDIECDVRIDDHVSIWSTTQIRNRTGAWVYEQRLPEMQKDDSVKWGILESGQSSDAEVLNQLALLAKRIVARVTVDLYSAMTNLTRRLRVQVISTPSSPTPEHPAFDPGFLKLAVEGELARSAAIMVLRPQSADSASASYDVEVSQLTTGDKLWVVVRCVKSGREGRVLTSRQIVVKANDLDSLSRGLSALVAEIRQTMEADFVSATRTLAVVATSGAIDFRLKAPSGNDLDVTREIMRATTQKIRLLTDAGSLPLMALQVLSDVPGAARYSATPTSASEILSESDAEYLLLLNYQNLGEKVRLTSDLHSFELEHVAAGIYIDEQYVDLSQLDEKLDLVAIKICEYFTNSPRDVADHAK